MQWPSPQIVNIRQHNIAANSPSFTMTAACRSCYAQRPRMLRKRSHQAFTDMEAEQPLSPVLRPPHQEMDSGDSSSDGDEVMGTGDTSSSDRVTACMCAALSRRHASTAHTHKFVSSHAVTTNAIPSYVTVHNAWRSHLIGLDSEANPALSSSC